MSRLMEQIKQRLDSEAVAENLKLLFCETLCWEDNSAPAQALQVPNPVQQTLIAQPIARLAGIPVFRVEWHLEKLPTITQRRAVYRALSKTAIEHLLCYVTRDKRQLAFVWAHKRADGKIEMRTLPYRVGSPARTTIERLAELHFPYTASEPSFSEVLQRLETAFDVEAVSKQFYQEIANWYFWASKHVEFPMPPGETNRDAYIAQSLIRLITRLLFCWFIKEMGLIPRELFEPKALTQLLKEGDRLNTSEKTTYYKAILQNLFFATLNQEIDQRRFRGRNPNGLDSHRGITNLYRYEDLFTDPQAFLELMKSVPFLNGGLFECLDKVYRAEENREDIRIDGFSDHPKNPLRVPDFLFFSREQIVDLSADYGDQRYKRTPVRGLIHILNRYNFTVTESTPFDQEVALDPELAGKVFENLLASYNPETATTARKATGSYYTPRPIVEFMVDETLIAYFQNSLNDYSSTTEQKLRQLLAYDDESHDFSPEETERLIKAIDELKALDPACGSGAFLMGLLHKLVHILSKLDPGNQQWKERQIARIREAMRTAEKIEDAVIRERTLKELEAQIASIEDAFQRNELDYGRKLYLIENCIYGVDIQPIAVQIAKMRFFISLTIEQRIDPSQPNFGIRPLPNLETKFVSANTLIGINKPSQFALRNPEIDRLEAELRQIRERHFTARTPETKAKLRKQDAEIRAQISQLLQQDGFPAEITEKLARWNPYDQNAVADFFDHEWMFGLKEGFDIVIGNPPYIQLQKDGGKLANQYQNKNYETFDRMGDIYCLFYERGIQLLKGGGYLCYITSNKWMRAGYGKKLRQFFLKYNPLVLIDLGPDIFESATVDTNILLIQKAQNHHRLRAVTIEKQNGQPVDLARQLHEWGVVLTNLSEDAWFIGSTAEQQLKEKIERIGKPLKEWDVNIYRGIITGLNEAFIIDTQTRDAILANCRDEAERKRTEAIIKPVLRGRDIKRYYYEWKGLWIIVIPAGWTNRHRGTKPAQEFVMGQFPALMKHLKPYEAQAKKRYDKGDYWWELRECAYYEEFEKEKVVYSEIVRQPQFYFDDSKFYIEATGFLMTGQHLKYICGLLNSRPVAYFFKQWYAGGGLGEEGYRYKKAFLENLPLPPITKSNASIVHQIEGLVDWLLAKKRQNPSADTSDLERQIDQLVYQLYDLTPDEIALVERSVP